MKNYKEKITLNKNGRGCYIFDTIKGCRICKDRPKGCYNDCYAKNISSRYGFDFTEPIKRNFQINDKQLHFFGFQDEHHLSTVVDEIKKIDLRFIRIGEMGDPSENWDHTINICKEILTAGKLIVIITKHWKIIPDELLNKIKKLNICINTSISALDNDFEIKHRLNQFNKLENYCNSILRIVSCDFNLKNKEGERRAKIQDKLFKNEKIIDTVFRPGLNNPLVINGIINIEKVKFLKSYIWASRFNKKSYLGYCNSCPDMCGINL